MERAEPLTRPCTAAARAEALDRWMGDPHDPGLPCSFRRVVERDEGELFAQDLYRAIDEVALASPLESRVDAALTARTIALRDPGLAFAWACSAAARDAVGDERATTMRGAVALVLPISSPIVASPLASGYRLSGDCPLTPNAGHATSWVIEADIAGTGRALFAADRSAITAVKHHVRAVGLRTAGIGACRLSSGFLRGDRCVRTIDRGADEMTAAGSAQLMVAAISLGIADTVLRAYPDVPAPIEAHVAPDDEAATLFVHGFRRREMCIGVAPDAVWLVAGIDRLTRRRRPLSGRIVRPPIEPVLARLLHLYESDRMFSLVPFNLARRTASRSDSIGECPS